MRFGLVYVLGGAMCKGSPWGVRVAGAVRRVGWDVEEAVGV